MPLELNEFDCEESQRLDYKETLESIYNDFLLHGDIEIFRELNIYVYNLSNDEMPTAYLNENNELCIQLHINGFYLPQIIFQFVHELGHCYFYFKDVIKSSMYQYHIGNTIPSINEEKFCTALSLAYLKREFSKKL